MTEWEAAAAQHDTPSPHSWDLFISHAGDDADKPFARALKQLLERLGWGLRVFLDDESLPPCAHPKNYMRSAMKSTHVAALLFSKEFFERTATKDELELLLKQHTRRRVELLPVFLRVTVAECQKELNSLFPQGMSLVCHTCVQNRYTEVPLFASGRQQAVADIACIAAELYRWPVS